MEHPVATKKQPTFLTVMPEITFDTTQQADKPSNDMTDPRYKIYDISVRMSFWCTYSFP